MTRKELREALPLVVAAFVAAVMMGATASIAFAASYSLSGSWTDVTTPGPAYLPIYKVEYRINGGTAVSIGNLATPNFSTALTANPTDLIEARAANCNTYQSSPPLCGPWSAWVSATAPYVPTVPAATSNFSIVIVPQ